MLLDPYRFAAAGGGGSLLDATGGTVTTDGNFRVHKFTTSGTFTVTAGSGTAAVLVVGGGGAGGRIVTNANGGGGGGAGQVYAVASQPVAVGDYPVVIGAGGISTLYFPDATHDGIASSFAELTAIGGGAGHGASTSSNGGVGRNGGSGGGGCGTVAGGTGTAGNNGGFGSGSNPYRGGGGGGAGSAGANGAISGIGGAGVSNSITGTAVFYGGGGGGGMYTVAGGAGGTGGGGSGNPTVPGNGVAGTANTGGGGGGAGSSGAGGGFGGAGGSGVVIIRYEFAAGGAGHRYWRINSIVTDGGYFQISELRVFSGATDVTATATKTASDALLAGTLAELFDNNLTNQPTWSEAVAEAAGFYIQFDFGGVPTEVNGVKQAGCDNPYRYMAGFRLQYSDDGSAWTTLGTKSGLTYPGNFTMSALYTFP